MNQMCEDTELSGKQAVFPTLFVKAPVPFDSFIGSLISIIIERAFFVVNIFFRTCVLFIGIFWISNVEVLAIADEWKRQNCDKRKMKRELLDENGNRVLDEKGKPRRVVSSSASDTFP